MSVLDYLVPGSFQSDVQGTFTPKQFATITSTEFTPGRSDQGAFDQYMDMINQGYNISPEAYEILTSGKHDREAHFASMGLSDRVGDYYAGIFDPESEYYAFSKPGEQDPISSNIFAGGTLAQGFQRAGIGDYDPSMAKTASLSTLRALDPGSYSGMVRQQRGSLADKLMASRQMAQAQGGGFAGYGGRGAGEAAAEEQFTAGVQDVYGQVAQQRGLAMKTLQDRLKDYGGFISEQQGGQGG